MITKCFTLFAGFFFAAATLASAATNDLSSALQRGLFEEEANHNLEAAIKSYQTVATQFDKDRKLAATAIFRLGECYRKQGKTNEASAQYERILKEFSDQTELVKLSRTFTTTTNQVSQPEQSFNARLSQLVGQAAVVVNPEDQEIQRIKTMIKDSPDLINSPSGGRIPLHQAAENHWLKVAEFLLANGADVNRSTGSSTVTALHHAVGRGYKSMVELLLAKGADTEARDDSGGTALHLASQLGFKSIAEMLLKNKANVNAQNSQANGNATPLHLVAKAGHKAVAELLLANGADVNVKSKSDSTPLISAVTSKNIEMTKFLIERKANVNSINDDGYAALHYAVRDGQSQLVQSLLQNGADPELKVPKYSLRSSNGNSYDAFEMTPLHISAQAGQREIVEILLVAKANPNSKNRDGSTPLHYAAASGSVEIVKMLLANGAQVNIQNNDGSTPLNWSLGSEKMTEFLLSNKANPNVQDKYGQTPLGYVKRNESPTREVFVALLQKYGANENAQRLSWISAKRNDNVSQVLYHPTNSVNEHTLLEFFVQVFSGNFSFMFPDLAAVKINRIDGNTGKTNEMPVNLEEILKSADCSRDLWLQWGDIVEIPEKDHLLNEQERGFAPEVTLMLEKCLTRKVFIVIKGEKTELTLKPNLPNTLSRPVPGQNFNRSEPIFRRDGLPSQQTTQIVLSSFNLRNVVPGSKLLRASSDSTRVKVTRLDPKTKQAQNFVFNLEKKEDLWLRDGDVIEVPEKQ